MEKDSDSGEGTTADAPQQGQVTVITIIHYILKQLVGENSECSQHKEMINV